VDRLPDDPVARRLWLEQWAAEQEDRLGPRELPFPRRMRVAAARKVQKLVKRADRYAERMFDRGLHTGEMVLDDPEHAAVNRIAYVASEWHVLPRALRYLRAGEQDVFVDFGCGKGRVVHQAARWPLRRVIGVEVSPDLARFARSLLAAHSHEHRCPDVEIVVCDAAAFEIPDDLSIAYFFDPFRGEILDAVLRNIIASIDRHPRRVRLIYVHPREAAQVLATQRFRLLKEQRGGLRDIRLGRAAIFESY
jgi:SAM-dependent methyltransferase